MDVLHQFAQSPSDWSLERLVIIANQLLPQFLPSHESSHRIQEDINPRLVRHYTTSRLIDKPYKEGREARYTYRHLLQLLVVRRLQSEGYSAVSINQLTQSKSNEDLESLLQGGIQLTVETANPALAFLQNVKARSPGNIVPSLEPNSPVSSESQNSAPTNPDLLSWSRIEVFPGFEIHVRGDFIYPSSDQERKNLLHLISQYLFTLASKRRGSQ